MALTEARSRWFTQGASDWNGLLPICWGLFPFPYTMFAGLFGFLLLGLWQTIRSPKAVVNLLLKSGFLAIALLMLVSASLAVFPEEAFLQMTHYLPFFWFWAFMTVYICQTDDPWSQIYRWSVILVLTSVPLNLIGIVEYIFKSSPSAELMTFFPLVDWLYLGDLYMPRAFSLFDYPNTLASYLTMILGLNLGLLFLDERETPWEVRPQWHRFVIASNILLTLMCLFCAGSRNGYLAAVVLLLVSLFNVRANRWVRRLGIAGLGIIITSTLAFGMAGRAVSWTWITNDPRLQVWALALRMIGDRPLMGHGLGSFKLLYAGEVAGHHYIAHAHNFWLTLASEAGLVVAGLFTVVVGMLWFRGYRALLQIRSLAQHHAVLAGYHLSFLGITVFSLLDITLFEARVNVLAWLSLSVIAASPKLSQLAKESTRSA